MFNNPGVNLRQGFASDGSLIADIGQEYLELCADYIIEIFNCSS